MFQQVLCRYAVRRGAWQMVGLDVQLLMHRNQGLGCHQGLPVSIARVGHPQRLWNAPAGFGAVSQQSPVLCCSSGAQQCAVLSWSCMLSCSTTFIERHSSRVRVCLPVPFSAIIVLIMITADIFVSAKRLVV
jgi:hypothetical protein